MPETNTEVPKALEFMVDAALRYRPKPVSAAARTGKWPKYNPKETP